MHTVNTTPPKRFSCTFTMIIINVIESQSVFAFSTAPLPLTPLTMIFPSHSPLILAQYSWLCWTGYSLINITSLLPCHMYQQPDLSSLYTSCDISQSSILRSLLLFMCTTPLTTLIMFSYFPEPPSVIPSLCRWHSTLLPLSPTKPRLKHHYKMIFNRLQLF